MIADRAASDARGPGAIGWSLLVTASLLLVWLIVRSMAVAAAVGGGDALAQRFAPDSAAALIGRSGMRAGVTAPPDAAQRALLERAAVRAPLRYEPWFGRSLAELRGRDWPAVIAAAEAARARQPRAVAVRGVLVQAYAQQRRLADTVRELNAILARSGGATTQILDMLVALADDPTTSSTVAGELRRNPRWRNLFIAHAAQRGGNQRIVFEALLRAPAGSNASAERAGRVAFMDGLIARGEYQRAYLAWVNFLSPEDAARAEAVYDGSFKAYGGEPPFNWRLTQNAAGSVERTGETSLPGGTALDVQFFGQEATELASQVLMLTPGNYRFQGVGQGSLGSQFGGALAWRLLCLPSDTTIELARVSQFPNGAFPLDKRITIPASGCSAQRLVLSGTPGEVTAPIEAQFTGLRLTPQ